MAPYVYEQVAEALVSWRPAAVYLYDPETEGPEDEPAAVGRVHVMHVNDDGTVAVGVATFASGKLEPDVTFFDLADIAEVQDTASGWLFARGFGPCREDSEAYASAVARSEGFTIPDYLPAGF